MSIVFNKYKRVLSLLYKLRFIKKRSILPLIFQYKLVDNLSNYLPRFSIFLSKKLVLSRKARFI